MPTEKKQSKTLEEMLERIDEISELLTEGRPLDESLELYKEGVGLIRSAEKLLSSAEKKIHTLTAKEISDESNA